MQKMTTADGSDTILSDVFGESYHSKHGAITESSHVFIQNGLLPQVKDHSDLNILEIGFGTGLNALLTMIELERLKRTKVYYVAYELYPITNDSASELNYPQFLNHSQAKEWLAKIHQAPWGSTSSLTPYFDLEKRKQSFEALEDKNQFHLIYMDAFAPSAQPEFWELPFLMKLSESLRPGGILVTYCAKGSFKRALIAAGFAVEGLPGPPGKREMTRAVRP